MDQSVQSSQLLQQTEIGQLRQKRENIILKAFLDAQ